MDNLEKIIDDLSYNLNILDNIFLQINSKYSNLKKYVSILNKEYLRRVDEWFFNNYMNNKYLKANNLKLSQLFFGSKLYVKQTNKLLDTLINLGFIQLISENTYNISRYNINNIILNSVGYKLQLPEQPIVIENDVKIQDNIAYNLISEYILSRIQNDKYLMTSDIEFYFKQNKQFTNIYRKVKYGIEKCAIENELIVLLCDKILKEYFNINRGYPKIIITKECYRNINHNTNCKQFKIMI